MKKALLLILSSVLTLPALANSIEYTVEGMHCGSCAKAIKAQVCKLEGLESCDVTVGKITLSPKAGVSVTKEQIEALMTKAGPYKITNSSSSK